MTLKAKNEMVKKLSRDRRAVAEIIGTLLAIVILMFFFTNVYLWHDAATKDANQFYLEKINSTFKIVQTSGNATNSFTLTSNGGSNIILSRLWIDDDATNEHYYADLGNATLMAGTNFIITFNMTASSNPSTESIAVSKEIGGVLIQYAPAESVNCSVINTLGVAESSVFNPNL